MPLDRLTDRQRRFVDLFHDRDDPRRTWCCATRAAAAAGYAWPGKQGPRLLTFPTVKAEVERQLAESVERMRSERIARIRREFPGMLRGGRRG